MGVLDKIKNALFEVEYVEVDEPPKKEKKPKFKEKFEKKESTNDDPIAKKIILPGKKNKSEHFEEEQDIAFEKDEKRVADEVAEEIIHMESEEKHDKFKIMDDNDFKVDDYPDVNEHVVSSSPIIEKADGRRTKREDFYESRVESFESDKKNENSFSQNNQFENVTHNAYKEKEKDNKLYGVDNSYSVPVHEYGTYEKKEEKTYFKPSPIISPIYGILDKNYKKEDVVQKKEIRITSNFTRSNVSVDDVRDKAYGEKKSESNIKEEVPETSFEVEDDGEDDNLLVDLSDRAKPEVKELTVGDAVEYFQDLGLEYNVDYVDVSKQNNSKSESNESKFSVSNEKPIIHSHVAEEDQNIVAEEMNNISYDEPKMTTTVEVKDESAGSNSNIDDDDNLFDLIDSMYQEND